MYRLSLNKNRNTNTNTNLSICNNNNNKHNKHKFPTSWPPRCLHIYLFSSYLSLLTPTLHQPTFHITPAISPGRIQGTWTPLCSSVSFSRQYVHPIPLPLLPGVHSILSGNRALASRAMETTLSRLYCRHQTSFGGHVHCQMRDSSQYSNAFIHPATGLSRS